MNRREFLGCSAAALAAAIFEFNYPLPAWALSGESGATGSQVRAKRYDLTIGDHSLMLGGREARATAINDTVPGPLIRLREGEAANLNVTNLLKEDTSIHWHGLIVPPEMDGVPGVSFAGIPPGETFHYKFPVQQSGTYWYHSHSGLQEQSGVYGPIIIEPAGAEPFSYDRDYIVLLADWTFEDPHRILANLKKQSDYYNFQQRTLGDFFRDISEKGISNTLAERKMWGQMRMDPTDISDITGYAYSYLLNGLPSVSNWTGLFHPGERIRLRLINAAAASYFDVRIPGLEMTVVQADGQNIQPVRVDELRIAIAETYDVIVRPSEERAYTIFAEAMDRSGFARGTLAPRLGMAAEIPERRPRLLLSMDDMGMAEMNHSGMKGMDSPAAANGRHVHAAHGEGGPVVEAALGSSSMTVHGADTHGPGNSAVATVAESRLDEPGIGLNQVERRVLLYSDLRSVSPATDQRSPSREIELHLTGNMERYMWSFDGKKFSEVKTPIIFYLNERLRLTLVNDTMMNHPIHLHGMWMELDNGAGVHKPRKHTVNVKPAERLSVEITADAEGDWAFHCHILYHMEMGMFRVVSVVRREANVS